MSTLCPYSIIKGDDGLSVKVEWDVHYLTDEQIGTVRKYVTEIEAENEKLRQLARHLYACLSFCDREDEERGCGFCPYRSASENCEFEQRLLELGVEVDA